MSADGNLKFASNSHPPASHKKRAERTCALCERLLRGQPPPVLLKSGQSVHVDCYFRMQKEPGRGRTN
jgi:hypothetical protein